jgi:hypothetical protein
MAKTYNIAVLKEGKVRTVDLGGLQQQAKWQTL